MHFYQQVEFPAFERLHLAEVIAVRVIERSVRKVLGVLVAAEQDLEYVGAGNPTLRLYLRVQLRVVAHVVDQPRVLRRLRLLVGNQRVHETEFGQSRQYIVNSVIHGVQCVDQCCVPVEQHDARRHQRPRCFVEFA